MDEKLMKLMAQLALLFVVVWVVASALGKGRQAVPGWRPRCRNRVGCGGKYRGIYSQYGGAQARKYYQPSVAQGASATGISVPYGVAVL